MGNNSFNFRNDHTLSFSSSLGAIKNITKGSHAVGGFSNYTELNKNNLNELFAGMISKYLTGILYVGIEGSLAPNFLGIVDINSFLKNKIPLDLHGDHLGLHMTFISLPTNNLKNIKSLFSSSDLKIERVISKPLACGVDLLNKNKGAKNFILVNFDKEVSSISIYEDSSLVFLKIFPFS